MNHMHGIHPFQTVQLGSSFKSQHAGFLNKANLYICGFSTRVPPELLAHAWGWWIVKQQFPCLCWINVVSAAKQCAGSAWERDAQSDDKGRGKKKTERGGWLGERQRGLARRSGDIFSVVFFPVRPRRTALYLQRLWACPDREGEGGTGAQTSWVQSEKRHRRRLKRTTTTKKAATRNSQNCPILSVKDKKKTH